MYQLTLVNCSPLTLTTSDGTSVEPNAQWQSAPNLGNAWIKTDEAGAASFLDIGDRHIPGDSKETWGVLISYQGEEIVGRYEGGGQLHVRFNKFMQLELTGMHLRRVSLPSLELA